MIDLRDFIMDVLKSAKKDTSMNRIMAFLVDNRWFGCKPFFADGKVLLDDNCVRTIRKPLEIFLTVENANTYLLERFRNQYPLTAKYFEKFCDEENANEDITFYVMDFLLYHLKKDVVLCCDDEIKKLLVCAAVDLTKYHGDFLTFFLAWLRAHTKTAYSCDYIMEKRYRMTIQNEAYSFDEYLELLYYLFNEDYIIQNDMYKKAAKSKKYTDTWLYLSVHFICSLRYTDLQRIYHPDLPYPAQEVIQRILDGSFTQKDALSVLLSVTDKLAQLPLEPSKTARSKGIASIKFTVPASCEEHFGVLFALAEAHRQLDGTANSPIIRRVSTYAEISRYMGDEIGGLFLESDFRSRSATKSYLQAIYMLSDDIIERNRDVPNVKGYILAAIARSHKGSAGKFAETTFVYLKDAKFNGLTPEFVAFELFERGILSFIPGLLLKMISGENYTDLSVKHQTTLVKELSLSPAEIERVVDVVDKGRSQAVKTLKEVISSDIDVLTALHRIGAGQAFAKQPECLCLLSAINKLCPFTGKRQCVGCKFEISTKSTYFLLISEFNRMNALYGSASNENEKEKYKQIITNIVLPKIDEMLYCLREHYGDDVFYQYEAFLKENIL